MVLDKRKHNNDVLLNELVNLQDNENDIAIKRTSKSLFTLLTKQRFSTDKNERLPNQDT
jgi:hypothetical protein